MNNQMFITEIATGKIHKLEFVVANPLTKEQFVVYNDNSSTVVNPFVLPINTFWDLFKWTPPFCGCCKKVGGNLTREGSWSGYRCDDPECVPY